jgi:hypothetical protein
MKIILTIKKQLILKRRYWWLYFPKEREVIKKVKRFLWLNIISDIVIGQLLGIFLPDGTAEEGVLLGFPLCIILGFLICICLFFILKNKYSLPYKYLFCLPFLALVPFVSIIFVEEITRNTYIYNNINHALGSHRIPAWFIRMIFDGSTKNRI